MFIRVQILLHFCHHQKQTTTTVERAPNINRKSQHSINCTNSIEKFYTISREKSKKTEFETEKWTQLTQSRRYRFRNNGWAGKILHAVLQTTNVQRAGLKKKKGRNLHSCIWAHLRGRGGLRVIQAKYFLNDTRHTRSDKCETRTKSSKPPLVEFLSSDVLFVWCVCVRVCVFVSVSVHILSYAPLSLSSNKTWTRTY